MNDKTEEHTFTREWVRQQRDRLAEMLPEMLDRMEEIVEGKYKATEVEVATYELILSKLMPTVTEPHYSLLRKITVEEDD